jgi:hypothetical protein
MVDKKRKTTTYGEEEKSLKKVKKFCEKVLTNRTSYGIIVKSSKQGNNLQRSQGKRFQKRY